MKKEKWLNIILICCMILTTVRVVPAYGLEEAYDDYVVIEEVRSSEAFDEEYFLVKTPILEENVIYVEGKTMVSTKLLAVRLLKCGSSREYGITTFVKPNSKGEFSMKINLTEGNKNVPTIIDGKGTVTKAGDCYDTKPGYRAVESLSKGFYRLVITSAFSEEEADLSQEAEWWKGPLGGNTGYTWKGATLWCDGSSNNLKLVKFNHVIDQKNGVRAGYEPNIETIDSYKGSYERYLDKDLNDMKNQLKNYTTGEKAVLTDSQIDYLTNVSKKITKNDINDYEKMASIYAFVAGNFYYDYFAHKNSQHQYVNPYENIYAVENGIEIPNSRDGKYATVCDGFAAMVVALARMENIPCRIVDGIYSPRDNFTWDEISENMESNHWWAEAYIDGKWIIVDARVGCLGAWNRNTANDTGTWQKNGAIKFSGFDVSEESFSTEYLLRKIKAGSNLGKYLCYREEVEVIRNFLNIEKDDITNGKILNASYNQNNLSTWGTGEEFQFINDGYGRLHQILWGGKGLSGVLDLSGCEAVKFVSVYSNDLTGITLKECETLSYLSAIGNNIEFIYATDSPKLETLLLRSNPMKHTKFYHKNQVVEITGEEGTFSFDYESSKELPLTIYVGKTPDGMVFEGVYDDSGNLISKESTYSFDPKESKYTVLFRDNSDERLEAPIVKVDNEPWKGNIRLSWDAVNGANQYEIYRSDSQDGKYVRYKIMTETTFQNSVVVGSTYYYKVKAVNTAHADKTSAFSNIVKGTQVLARMNIKAGVDEKSGKVNVTWDAITGADFYKIYRATSSGEAYVEQGTVKSTSYLDKTAKPGFLYYYKAVAVYESDTTLNSVESNMVSKRAVCARPTIKISNTTVSGKPQISWSAVEGADKYYVYRSTTKDGTYSYLRASTSTSYVDTSAVGGKVYYYKIRAVYSANENANSAQSSYVYTRCKLTQPTGLKISTVASSGKPQITWNAVEGADKYYVYRSTTKDGTYSYLRASTATSYVDTSAVRGKVYYYKIRAVYSANENANSAQSSYVYTRCKLTQPTGLKMSTIASSGKPQITWNAVEGANKYYVYRSTTKDGTYSYLRASTATSYVDNSAVGGKIYYYKVRAVYTTNENANSAQSSYVYTRCKLAKPTGLKISTVASSGKPRITWNAVEGADKYYVYRSATKDGTYSYLRTSTATSYVDTSAVGGKIYYYKVRAVYSTNENANSAQSSYVYERCKLL